MLTVVKEVAALKRCNAGRDRDQGEDLEDALGPIDEDKLRGNFCLVICLSLVWMFFFPSRSNHRAKAPY